MTSDSNTPQTFQHPQLMCQVESIRYDFTTCTGIITMPDLNCVNMTGAIALFTDLDPRVSLIITVAGGIRDTTYRRDGQHWSTFLSRPSQ